MRCRFSILAGCFAALAVSVVGCGPASDDVEVTGTVTWNGKPVDFGSISLFPVDPHVAPVGGKVIDGKFKLRSRPVKMRVEIESIRDTGKRDPIDNAPLGEMFIPARYNKNSELTIEPTERGENHFNFPLKE